MPIIDIQKRARELGRIRIGQVVPTQSGKTRPEKLDRFRLTSSSKPLLDKVAELYGGQVREWQPQGGGAQAWEVITETNRIPILVPPQPVTQWMEHWTGGGCKRRCDGQTEVISDQPCICKADEAMLCKPTTRLNVVLRDVEGIGVWRLETHGWNAAIELPDAAAFLAQAGGYVEGHLALEQRTSKAEVTRNGETKVETRHFMVPTIEISMTPAELMAGKGGLQAPAVEGPVSRAAIGSGPTDPDLTAQLAPYYELLEGASTSGECLGIYEQAKDAGLFHGPINTLAKPVQDLYRAIGDRGRALSEEPVEGTGETVAGQVVEEEQGDPDAVWQQVLAVAGRLGWSLPQVSTDFVGRYGMSPDSASAGELGAYLQVLKSEADAA